MTTIVYATGGGGAGGVGSSTITTYPISTSTTSPIGSGTYVPATGVVGIGGGGGSAGSVYTTSGTGPQWQQYSPNNTIITMTGNSPVIKTEKNELNIDEAAELIKILKERLLILIPNFENHEKYAALKKAYDHYKLIEALIKDDENGK